MSYNPERQICVYIVDEEGSDDVAKIGITELLTRRIAGMQSNNWRKLTIYAAFPVPTADIAWDVEQWILQKFKEQKIRGEWFRIKPESMEQEVSDLLQFMGLSAINLIKSGDKKIAQLRAKR